MAIRPPAGGGGGAVIRHARITTGSIAGAGEADVTVTWPSAFSDTNYTVTAQVEEDAGGESLRVRRVRSKTTTDCVVNVQNNAVTARTGTVNAIAVAD